MELDSSRVWRSASTVICTCGTFHHPGQYASISELNRPKRKRFGPPPFGWSLNGVPIEDRAGNQIKGQRRQRAMLDICGQCNARMNSTIEMPAKPIVTALALNGWKGRYRGREWRAVGLWWVKVLLLVGHEKAQLDNPRLQKAVRYSFEPPMPDLRWLTDGTGIPDHVSVYVHNADMMIEHTEFDLSIPAHVNFDDGLTAHCHVLSMATPGLCVTVVSHPGVKIAHPMVSKREAWELLHSPPRRGDLGRLKPVGRKHVLYFRGGGVPEGHVADDSEFKFLVTTFGYEPNQMPPATTMLARMQRRLCRLIGRPRTR